MFSRIKQSFSDWFVERFSAWGLTEAWQTLSAKDRRALKMLALILLLAAGYFFLWQPIMQAQHKAQTQLQAAQQEWQWLNSQLPKLANAQPQTQLAVRSQAQLTQTLQQALAKMNLSSQMSEIKPQQVAGKPGVLVNFNKVMAPRFFRWLSELEQQGLKAQKMTVKPIENGWISAQVSFNF